MTIRLRPFAILGWTFGLSIPIAIIGCTLYFAAMFGLLGDALIPRGNDATKMAYLADLRASIRSGLPFEDVQSAFSRAGLDRRECKSRRAVVGGQQPEYPGADCVVTAIMRNVSWTGVVSWNVEIRTYIKNGRVDGVVFDTYGDGP